MATDLAVRKVELTNEQLQYIAHTEFVPAGLRGNLPAILACVATGRSLGISDMTALRSIHIIDGKATFSAELMVMLARQQGHSIQGTVAEGVATVVGKRADNGDTMTVEWTMVMAERAKLTNKQNWVKYPESMLWARAVSQLCRELFADCYAGATYTPEELEGSSDGRADSQAEEEGPRSPTPPAGGSDEKAPGMAARTPEPHTGSSGVPSAAIPAPTVSPSPVGEQPSRGPSEDEPTTPLAQLEAATEGLEPVDMADPDIPFGDAPPVRYITARQRTRLFTIAGNGGVSEEDLRAIVRELTGQESTKLIPAGVVYDSVVTAVQAAGA